MKPLLTAAPLACLTILTSPYAALAATLSNPPNPAADWSPAGMKVMLELTYVLGRCDRQLPEDFVVNILQMTASDGANLATQRELRNRANLSNAYLNGRKIAAEGKEPISLDVCKLVIGEYIDDMKKELAK